MFSVCFSIPVGGAYGASILLAENGAPDQCHSLAGALTPKDQHRIREYRASTGLTAVQERALNVRVCDRGTDSYCSRPRWKFPQGHGS